MEEKQNSGNPSPQKSNQPNIPGKPADQNRPEQNKSGEPRQGKSEASQPKKPYYNNRYRRHPYNKPERKPGEFIQKKIAFKKVSIIIPLLNEEDSIRPLASEIKKVMRSIVADYEVIFVDDGSTDNSLKVIKEFAKSDPKFKYISFRKNYGKSAALQIGFKNATGDVIITMDADLQDDPNEIPNLIQKLSEGYDLVSGWKKERKDPFIKRHSSRFFNFVTGLMSGIKIHDFNCGLKAYRANVLKNINVYGELHRYVPVLADWQGYKISEVTVKHHPRRFGKTKFGISRFFKGFIDLLTVMFTTRYIKKPMHLFGFLGALAFLVGFIVNGYLTYEWLIGKTYIGNRPLLFLGILLIIVGVQFFSVGLLGELIVHNSQDDKEYSIKDKG